MGVCYIGAIVKEVGCPPPSVPPSQSVTPGAPGSRRVADPPCRIQLSCSGDPAAAKPESPGQLGMGFVFLAERIDSHDYTNVKLL